MNAKEQAVKIRLNGASQDPVRGELVTGQARPDQSGRHQVQLTGLRHPAQRAALFAASSIH